MEESKKIKMTCKISKKELAIGTKKEMEHTKSKKVAERIAMDHLKEHPNYYTKGLIPMERKLKRMQKLKSKIKRRKTTKRRIYR